MLYRGDRVWAGENKIPATMFRYGEKWSTLVFARNGRWFIKRVETSEITARDEEQDDDLVADESLEFLP